MRPLLLLLLSSALFADVQQLFNGKDLSGWEMVGPGRFLVEDGMMKTEGGMGLLWYKGRKLGNETLRVVFKTTGERDNSGVVVRLAEPPPDPWYGVHNGYEIQIDAVGDEWHMTGAIYSLSRATKRAQKPTGEWNTMEIELDGKVTRVRLNGELVNEFKDGQAVPERKQWYEPIRGPRPDFGFIGLQNHDPRTTVYFKEVSATTTEQSPRVLSQGDRDRLLSYYHSTRKQILDAVDGLSTAQWTYKPSPQKWSIAEVVEHITLTEDFLFQHMTGFLKHSLPKPAEQKLTAEGVVAMMKDRSKPAQAPAEVRPTGRWQAGPLLTAAFKNQRDQTIQWIINTREPLKNAYLNWGGGVIDVYQGMYATAAHTERHLAQIQEVKAAAGYPAK